MSINTWPVFGHEWAVEWLDRRLQAGQMSHAVLFTGPAQIGKRTLALATAAALNCAADDRPCGQCRSCRLVAQNTHPDVRVIEAETPDQGREGVLKIDQIRELQRFAALAPMEARYKVLILREIERATLPAANALLKTLEEPPAYVVLILTSARPHALLPTVVSRCQTLPLRVLPRAQVAAALAQRWQAAPDQAELLARLAQGRLGWAVKRLTDHSAADERAHRLARAQALPRQGLLQRLAFAEELSKNPATVQATLAVWISWWRDVMLVQEGCAAFMRHIDHADDVTREAGSFAPAAVRAYVQRLQAAPIQLNQNANPRLLLETLMLHMPALAPA